MTTAAVAASGLYGGSNSRNHVSPVASLAVMPACAPDVFSLKMTHREGSGGAPTLGPRTTSSIVSALVPMRLVNQLESGTSSMVLTFCARSPEGLRRDTAKLLYVNSYSRSTSESAAPEA